MVTKSRHSTNASNSLSPRTTSGRLDGSKMRRGSTKNSSVASPTKQQIEAFLCSQTFSCAYLRARITPRGCATRQGATETPPTQITVWGAKINLNAGPQGVYCKSQQCGMGKRVVTELGLKPPPLKPKAAPKYKGMCGL